MSSVLKPLFWSQSDILFLSLFFHFCWTCSLLFTKDSILSLLFPLTSFFPQLLFFKDTFMLFYYYFLIWPHCTSCRILVPSQGSNRVPAVKALGPNHWTARGFPDDFILMPSKTLQVLPFMCNVPYVTISSFNFYFSYISSSGTKLIENRSHL